MPSRRSHRQDGLCIEHAKGTDTPSRKRQAPAATRTTRTRWRVCSKKPRRALYTQAYMQCCAVGCLLRAQKGSRCKWHHAQYLNGLCGMGAARYALGNHSDDNVPKHCLNNATAARFPDLTNARSTAPHICPQARFCETCPQPSCRAQYFPEETSSQPRGGPLFTLCCMRGKFSNLQCVPADSEIFPPIVAIR